MALAIVSVAGVSVGGVLYSKRRDERQELEARFSAERKAKEDSIQQIIEAAAARAELWEAQAVDGRVTWYTIDGERGNLNLSEQSSSFRWSMNRVAYHSTPSEGVMHALYMDRIKLQPSGLSNLLRLQSPLPESEVSWIQTFLQVKTDDARGALWKEVEDSVLEDLGTAPQEEKRLRYLAMILRVQSACRDSFAASRVNPFKDLFKDSASDEDFARKAKERIEKRRAMEK
ncbi:MAG: hypothetical protein AAB074_12955 [Planctomycetota bacterium]